MKALDRKLLREFGSRPGDAALLAEAADGDLEALGDRHGPPGVQQLRAVARIGGDAAHVQAVTKIIHFE